MKSNKVKMLNFRVEQALEERMKQVAQESGIKFSDLMRQALIQYCEVVSNEKRSL